MAFVDRTDGSLCLAPVRPKPTVTRCATDSRWAYERLAWGVDGRSLLAVARGRQPAAGDGIVRYALPASATTAVTWHPKERQATLAVPARNVQHVALAPAGDVLAMTVGAPGQPGQVFVGAAAPGSPAPVALEGVTACEIAYTAEGRLTTSSGPCAHATSKIEVHGENGERTAAGTGNDPAWQPVEVTP